MQLTLTAKIQIFPNVQDIPMLYATVKAYTFACNYVSDYVFQTQELNNIKLHNKLYTVLREQFALKSQMAQSVLRTVIARYKSASSNKHPWTRIIFKKSEYDLVWNRDYSLSGSSFSINTLERRIHTSYSSKGMEQYFNRDLYRFGTAKLVSKKGKFFLHIPVTCELADVDLSKVCNIVGIDRGINFVTATYDSCGASSFISGKSIKQKRAHYAKLRKELQMCKTPSSRRRLKAIGQRENRWMRDVNHCVSKALVKNNPKNTFFVLEDLSGIRNSTEKVHLKNRYISVSWSFYDLEQKLIYKAAHNQSSVIKVNPAYTSQRCPVCGHIEKSNRDKRIHLFCCKSCNYRSNDDRIGAMNLYQLGKEYLAPMEKDLVV